MASEEKWAPGDERAPEGDAGEREHANGGPANGNDGPPHTPADGDDYRSDAHGSQSGGKSGSSYREKQVKPNKVYIGGLPEHTRQEDLRSCFGKIGNITNIELKLGYGFVEFDSREAAEESVAKYHEGYFMGNKIKVEMSHGGGRTAKYTGDPGACFKCGQMGHWARGRECPNTAGPGDRPSSRDFAPPPPARDYPPYREDFPRYPPPRDARYGFGGDYPPPPPGRDFRRPASPAREYREFAPPPVPRARDYDDYRMRPPPPPPPARGYYGPDGPPGYPPRGYDAPPRDVIDRVPDRRAPPPSEKYPPYPAPAARPRTPPGPPPRSRDDYDRPPRDYAPPSEYRGRPTTPPLPPPPSSRYADYPPRTGGSDQASARYRRRSQSPPPRSAGSGYRAGGYVNDSADPPASYSSGGAPYNGAGGYSSNGYAGGPPGSAPPRSGGSGRDRDYPPRNGVDGYSRRA